MKKVLNAQMLFKFIFSVFFVGVILFVFYTAYRPYVEEHYLKKETPSVSTAQAAPTRTKFDGKKEYPFKKATTKKPSANQKNAASEQKTLTDRVRDKISRTKKALDKRSKKIFDDEEEYELYVTDDFKYYMDAILLRKRFEKVIGFTATTSANGMKNSMNTAGDLVVELDDGNFSYIVDDVNVMNKAKKVVAFAESVEKRGMNFLLFETPVKANDSLINKKYLGAYHDFSNQKMADVFGLLDKNNVAYYSMTKYVDEHFEDRQALFFRSDHHWLPQTALLADKLLSEELNARFGYDIDTEIFDLKNYTVTETEPIYLGALGRKVTEVYSATESIPLIVPNYETKLSVFRSKSNETYRGDIDKTLLWEAALELGDKTIYDIDQYRYYAYGNMDLMQIHNLNKPDGKRVLIIKTSFVNAMAPYLCNIAEYVDFIDLRYFEGSVQTYIDTWEPDTVVLAYGPTAFENGGAVGGFYENSFNFN